MLDTSELIAIEMLDKFDPYKFTVDNDSVIQIPSGQTTLNCISLTIQLAIQPQRQLAEVLWKLRFFLASLTTTTTMTTIIIIFPHVQTVVTSEVLAEHRVNIFCPKTDELETS